MTNKYRKKPVEIEACFWNGTEDGAAPIVSWINTHGGMARWFGPNHGDPDCPNHGDPDCPSLGGHTVRHFCRSCDYNDQPSRITICTLEGAMSASPGDWIIRGVAGEFYPCKPDIFDATYEVVAE